MPEPDSTTAGAQTQSAPPQDSQPSETPESWDTFIAAQPDTIKTLYEAHTQGLRSALQSERTQRSDLEKQLRDAAKKQPADSAEQANLTKMADDLALANRRSDFYELAVKPEVGVTDLKAAWLIANADADEYFNKRGEVNFPLLKERHPGLFRQAPRTPPANAGNGAGGQAATNGANMNNLIRRAAGRE